MGLNYLQCLNDGVLTIANLSIEKATHFCHFKYILPEEKMAIVLCPPLGIFLLNAYLNH
jgi:hypothetical protein